MLAVVQPYFFVFSPSFACAIGSSALLAVCLEGGVAERVGELW